MALLKTVRAKLTTLVGLSALATLAALPLLHWLMTRELVDVVDDRVPEAVKGFEVELVDDIGDLVAATRSLADSDELQQALSKLDEPAASEELKVFHDAYPGTSFIVYATSGKVLAQVGLAASALPRGSFAGIEALDKGVAETRMIAAEGCSAAKSTDPSFVMARSVRSAGVVVACMTIDAKYLANTSAKLGVELAVARGDHDVGTRTAGFPYGALAAEKGEALVDVDGKAWATTHFEPAPFAGVPGRFSVVAALDMTRIRGVVRKNLALTVVVHDGLGHVLAHRGAQLVTLAQAVDHRVEAGG
jgi:adenylate cyclase